MERAAHTHTDPSRTISHRQSRAPAGPERNHRKRTEPAAGPEDGDARIDNEPLHREVAEAGTGVTTTRKPVLRAHTALVIERTGDRNTVAESHFQSNLSRCTSWRGVGHTVSYEINAFLLQYALNRLNILLILTGNANVTLDLAVTVLKNFELKRNTIKTENDVSAR